jgi:photosystem II stability/assembly factor-like uncharacterized protein
MMNAPVLENQSVDVIYGLAASPHFATDKRCYAARQSGLWMSSDGGSTWQSAFASLDVPEQPSATAVAVAPDGTLFVGVPGGILTSTDSATTWTKSALPTPPPLITTMVISPDFSHDGLALAGSLEDGVFVTIDRGQTWRAWNFGLLDQNSYSLAFSPDFSRDKRVYAGTESGIFYSRNGGRSWQAVPFPSELSPVLSLAISLDKTIWASTDSHGLFYSTDEGTSWEQSVAAGSVNHVILSPQVPAKPDMLTTVDDRLLISRDQGQTWTLVRPSLGSERAFTTVIAPVGLDAGSLLLLGSDEGEITTTILK